MRNALVLTVFLFAAALFCPALAVWAAGEVVVTASPSEAYVGQPVEILLRTFVPFERSDFGLTKPREPYPVASGFYTVLYPWDDYPFDVEALPDIRPGPTIKIVLARDPLDATLWRGTVTFPQAGSWTVYVRNFPSGHAGASTVIQVREAASRVDADPLAIAGAALLGLVVGAGAGAFVALRAARQTEVA